MGGLFNAHYQPRTSPVSPISSITWYNNLMKHHCHCGFEKHRHLAKGKRLGALGIAFMVLHLLYHVAECLILPAVFMAFSNHSSDAASAASEDTIIIEPSDPQPQASLLFRGLNFDTLYSQSLQNPQNPQNSQTLQPALYTNFFETLY